MVAKDYTRPFWLLALGLFLFHLIYIWLTPLDLSPDEAYYWDWSRDLALGYYSKPPLVAWVIAFLTHLGGDHPFFIRLGAVLFSLGSSIVLFYLGTIIYNTRVGLWAFVIGNATPGFAVASVIMTIDAPLMFFWGLTILLLYLALSGRGKAYWYAAGISLGMGGLSKYTAFALIPSLLFYLSFSPTRRSWLKRKEPYLFLLISLLILVPNFYWNYIHQWTAFKQPAELVDDRNLSSLTTFIWFFGPQAGILSPITFLLVIYGLWQGGKRGIFYGDDRALFLFWHSITLLGFFIVLSFFSVCYVNWAAPTYIAAFVLATGIVREGKWRERTKRKTLATALIVGIVISLCVYNIDMLRPLGLVRPRDIPTYQLRGWHELGDEVSRLLTDMGREKTFLISDRRQFASELAFYVEGHPRVYTLNLTAHIKSQYDLWDGFEDKIGFNALYVTKLGRRPPSSFGHAFDTVEEINQVKTYVGGEFVKGYSIFYCRGFHGLGQTSQLPPLRIKNIANPQQGSISFEHIGNNYDYSM